MPELSEIDLKILRFINQKGVVSKNDLRRKFKNLQSLDLRIQNLKSANPALIIQNFDTTMDGALSRISYRDSYQLSDSGAAFLQNHQESVKSARKDTWLKNAWIPILVSLVTNLLLRGIEQLWPLIQEWVSSNLS